jgi:hypothetical protein
MAVVLVLLALILIAGGGAALFSGYEILLGDRGQPMMLAGATILSAGLVLLGLALLARLALRIARELADIRTALSDVRAANLLATARPPRAGGPEDRPAEPAFTPRLPEPAPEPETTEEGAELVVPDVPEEPVAPPPRPTPAPPPRPAPAPVLQAVAPAPAPAPPPAPVFQPAPPPPAPEPEPDVLMEAPEVVGSYSSGGNHYTMYADGSIIAETPNGRHRFASLDELKDFVSRGGERG